MSAPHPVQAIAVVPGTHFETITAVALASVTALLGGIDAGTDVVHEPWATWLAGPFTKSVRRIKTAGQERRIVEDELTKTRFQVGDAVAYAYAPMTYDDFPKPLRQLQVTGLDVDRTRDAHPDRFTAQRALYRQRPVLSLNADLSMTTGKSAAQAAHALMLWTLTRTPEQITAWRTDEIQPYALEIQLRSFAALPDDAAPRLSIRDNGLTEIAAGSETARIDEVYTP